MQTVKAQRSLLKHAVLPDHSMLEAPAKSHLKILPAHVICCILLSVLSNTSIDANSVDPDQTAPIGAV